MFRGPLKPGGSESEYSVQCKSCLPVSECLFHPLLSVPRIAVSAASVSTTSEVREGDEGHLVAGSADTAVTGRQIPALLNVNVSET